MTAYVLVVEDTRITDVEFGPFQTLAEALAATPKNGTKWELYCVTYMETDRELVMEHG